MQQLRLRLPDTRCLHVWTSDSVSRLDRPSPPVERERRCTAHACRMDGPTAGERERERENARVRALGSRDRICRPFREKRSSARMESSCLRWTILPDSLFPLPFLTTAWDSFPIPCSVASFTGPSSCLSLHPLSPSSSARPVLAIRERRSETQMMKSCLSSLLLWSKSEVVRVYLVTGCVCVCVCGGSNECTRERMAKGRSIALPLCLWRNAFLRPK